MKVKVLLFASVLAIGFATQHALEVEASEALAAAPALQLEEAATAESPVMKLLLHAIEVAVSSQDVIAGI